MREDFTQADLALYWLGDREERDERGLYAFTQTLLNEVEHMSEEYKEVRDNVIAMSTELTAAREVIESAEQLMQEVQDHPIVGGCKECAAGFSEYSKAKRKYDKVVGK